MAKVRKQKDGEAGLEFNFNLEVLKLGVDDDGDDITSCVVIQTDEKSKKGTQTLSGKYKLAMNALDYCLADYGRKEQPKHDYPSVMLVDLKSWYAEMEARDITVGKTKAAENTNRWRIKEKLHSLGLVGILNDKIWKT